MFKYVFSEFVVSSDNYNIPSTTIRFPYHLTELLKLTEGARRATGVSFTQALI